MVAVLNTTVGATRLEGGALEPVLAPVSAVVVPPAAARGWTPVFEAEFEEGRAILKVADWTGGDGVKPPLGYVGPSGSGALVAKEGAADLGDEAIDLTIF